MQRVMCRTMPKRPHRLEKQTGQNNCPLSEDRFQEHPVPKCKYGTVYLCLAKRTSNVQSRPKCSMQAVDRQWRSQTVWKFQKAATAWTSDRHSTARVGGLQRAAGGMPPPRSVATTVASVCFDDLGHGLSLPSLLLLNWLHATMVLLLEASKIYCAKLRAT